MVTLMCRRGLRRESPLASPESLSPVSVSVSPPEAIESSSFWSLPVNGFGPATTSAGAGVHSWFRAIFQSGPTVGKESRDVAREVKKAIQYVIWRRIRTLN